MQSGRGDKIHGKLYEKVKRNKHYENKNKHIHPRGIRNGSLKRRYAFIHAKAPYDKQRGVDDGNRCRRDEQRARNVFLGDDFEQ